MNITSAQKIRIIVITIGYMFMFGFIKAIVLNHKLHTTDFLLNSILIFIWLSLSYALTNHMMNDDYE